jgi:hypothetical protein
MWAGGTCRHGPIRIIGEGHQREIAFEQNGRNSPASNTEKPSSPAFCSFFANIN